MAKKGFKKWGKEILIYLALGTALTIGMDFWRTKDMPLEQAAPIVGQSVDGASIDVMAMSHEKPAIVYFWATWCGACKFVSPTVNWFSDSYSVVGISLSSGSDERVSRYLEAHDYQFQNINDTSGTISRDWGISVTPTIAIIKDGKVETITTGVTTPVGLFARLLLTKI
ncbi:membrane protein [Vibrio ishigakensis]|uniref:Membrane protein n=1 Tax=Vibrio ishigakensis TaxID=1481914 RepID=A0A0B8PDT0_9VIBR|nr:membrane protein [Vibrio ishigakensis]